MTLETRKVETPQSRVSGFIQTDFLSQQMVGLRNRIQCFVGRDHQGLATARQSIKSLRITQFRLDGTSGLVGIEVPGDRGSALLIRASYDSARYIK